MTPTSRWYKCDLQVATPAWKFKLPPGSSYDFAKDEDRARFADEYMARLTQVGIEVIALADHHTSAWQDVMQAAGRRAGITVFPGVEVTTNSGSDGIHIVFIGDLGKTPQDVEILLQKTCGFDDGDHPKFDPSTGDPAASPRSLTDILDDLPHGWLALAPHALGANGVASGTTAKGSVRWKALHHDRLVALDVGEGEGEDKTASTTNKTSFNTDFRNRSLQYFPCLERIAFISTSDSYSLDELGTHYTWIRMEKPSLEALRQAFLDREARIIRHSDAKKTSKEDPNQNDHGWIESISFRGTLGNSSTPLSLDLHPRLNVIIGGRGSGKSTVVAGLRQVYGSVETLPESIKEEAEEFVKEVFCSTAIVTMHRLPISGEQQESIWASDTGSVTDRGGTQTATSFPVRILAQKELYERTKPDVSDPFRASRNLLLLIDEAIAAAGDGARFDFNEEQTAAEYRYQNAVQQHLQLQNTVSRRDEFAARIAELTRQIEVLDNPATKARRERNSRIMRQRSDLLAAATTLDEAIVGIRQQVDALLPDVGAPQDSAAVEPGTLAAHQRELGDIGRHLRSVLIGALDAAQARAARAQQDRLSGPWAEDAQRAMEDDAAYQAELEALGITVERYSALREELSSCESALKDIDRKRGDLVAASQAESTAWEHLKEVYKSRRTRRAHLVREVMQRSASLRFEISAHADWVDWLSSMRELLNLRTDGYVSEARELGKWLWASPEEERDSHLSVWHDALINSGQEAYAKLASEVVARKSWWDRIRSQDPAIRLRLAMLMADDVVTMRFLKVDHNPVNDDSWQEVSHGSPGQRSAAMLSFVLHHGTEPLVLDQPEDDLDTALISELIVKELRKSRWHRQLIIITHNANIPVLGDAERIIALENSAGSLRIRYTSRPHVGPLEVPEVRREIQNVMEGGVPAFITREQRYDNELSTYRQALSLSKA